MRITLSILLLLALVSAGIGCSGRTGMSTPGTYGESPAKSPEATKAEEPAESVETAATEPAEIDKSDPLAAHRSKRLDPDKTPDEKPKMPGPEEGDRQPLSFWGGADVSDSASAVDDDIWRRFDLAEEYYLMGVMANREASWEEAQYYFEKGLSILAKLDIEVDSTLSSEAVKYSKMLENFVADYRTTLRSLGHLESDVSPSVCLSASGRWPTTSAPTRSKSTSRKSRLRSPTISRW